MSDPLTYGKCEPLKFMKDSVDVGAFTLRSVKQPLTSLYEAAEPRLRTSGEDAERRKLFDRLLRQPSPLEWTWEHFMLCKYVDRLGEIKEREWSSLLACERLFPIIF